MFQNHYNQKLYIKRFAKQFHYKLSSISSILKGFTKRTNEIKKKEGKKQIESLKSTYESLLSFKKKRSTNTQRRKAKPTLPPASPSFIVKRVLSLYTSRMRMSSKTFYRVLMFNYFIRLFRHSTQDLLLHFLHHLLLLIQASSCSFLWKEHWFKMSVIR